MPGPNLTFYDIILVLSDLANKNTGRIPVQYLVCIYIKKLFVIYLKFTFNWVFSSNSISILQMKALKQLTSPQGTQLGSDKANFALVSCTVHCAILLLLNGKHACMHARAHTHTHTHNSFILVITFQK